VQLSRFVNSSPAFGYGVHKALVIEMESAGIIR
jgi:hypothetical protein